MLLYQWPEQQELTGFTSLRKVESVWINGKNRLLICSRFQSSLRKFGVAWISPVKRLVAHLLQASSGQSSKSSLGWLRLSRSPVPALSGGGVNLCRGVHDQAERKARSEAQELQPWQHSSEAHGGAGVLGGADADLLRHRRLSLGGLSSS